LLVALLGLLSLSLSFLLLTVALAWVIRLYPRLIRPISSIFYTIDTSTTSSCGSSRRSIHGSSA
jgi:hypothetical protein